MKQVKQAISIFGVLLAAFLFPHTTMAQFIANVDVEDVATIYRDQTDANGGGYISFCAGNLATASSTRRGLVRYETPTTGGGNVTVTRVRINMTQERVRSMGAGAPKTATLQIHRVTDDWMEGNGTGGSAACGGGGLVDGVDWTSQPEIAASASATHDLPSTNNHIFAIDTDEGVDNDGLLEDVQAWMNGAGNNGWAFSVFEEGEVNNARLITPDAVRVEWTESQFSINPGLNDVWWNSDFDGQGFSFTVYQELGFFFVTWYTYEVERPSEDVAATAILGEAGHRWLSAFGDWEGDTATLKIENSFGAVFHSLLPKVERDTDYGTMTIQFHNCNSATLTYDIPSLSLMGTMELTRVVTDNVAICEALIDPPQ